MMSARGRVVFVRLMECAAAAVRCGVDLVEENESVSSRLADLAAELEFTADAFRGHDAKA